ncbi:hypothetical protein CO180_03090 [candidate division WWE3 bacterium CG_4_9_14_3_um_filter_41_6]|nr:MAG: hypothetical protein CO180_03090 [candidate division WWE3 bacterium CG_4_9_14_3_um_filter_41_6]
MRIHFTCSTAEFEKYRDNYFKIRNILIVQGHVLSRDWLPHTEKRVQTGEIEVRDIKEIYALNIKALRESELVIVEDTVSNFSTGHQITLSLQQRKPTLVLWQGRKHRKFEHMFIHGIESNLLQITEYKQKDLDMILSSFVQKYQSFNETNRFHLVLSGVERQYLDWAHLNKKYSRTELIKEALHNKIDRDDEYQKYLQRGELE